MIPSIRRRLLVLLIALNILSLSMVFIWVYRDATHEVEELFDANLAQSARVLLGLAVQEAKERSAQKIKIINPIEKRGHKYESKIAVVVRYANGAVMLQSASAPKLPFTTDVHGFQDYKVNDQLWRTFSLRDDETGTSIQVAESYAIRNELAGDIIRDTFMPFAFFIPILALLVWLSIGRSLAPLKRLAREVSRRHPDSLDPISIEQVPQEVLPLIESLNTLLVKLHGALENERRFTGDAAHELRTPLAAIKTQAQVLQRADNTGVFKHTINNILQGVDRATHLVEQLLTMARMDAQESVQDNEQTDLFAVTRSVISDYGQMAIDKSIEISLQTDCESCPVQGESNILGIMIRNLVDNGIRYTPERGKVIISIEVDKNGTRLCVTDTGPGISQEEHRHIFERFKRLPEGTSNGTGLGLSIVLRIAELHDAKISLHNRDRGSGLVFCVQFPAYRDQN